MNKCTVTLIAQSVLVVGFFIFYVVHTLQETSSVEVVMQAGERDVFLTQFADHSIALAFDYLSGSDGYVIDDLTTFIGEEVEAAAPVKVYRIINVKEKHELELSEGGREGPPIIQLMVFNNVHHHSVSNWVDAFPMFSQSAMVIGGFNREVVVDGVNAVRYTTDGLYVTDNVVVANGAFMYHFSGAYLEPNSHIQQDFNALINSVRFIPAVTDSAVDPYKLNLSVVCESALAYMLFETVTQADQFVTECEAGEHPDVIERYRNEISVDGNAI